ncbi:hypothetical protein HJG60_011750 [Phyllostomus discolor]|uniref:Uncharacterized protein n=1 Tax=Phyllostomus discolor TaxID=89673 RepID=A0A833ZWD0_9CHIR|nr:hypothetical protein HJG60_011750 [Phyllostomus discolor]
MALTLKQTTDHTHVCTSQWLWRRRVTKEEQAVYQSTSCAVKGQGCIPPLQVPAFLSSLSPQPHLLQAAPFPVLQLLSSDPDSSKHTVLLAPKPGVGRRVGMEMRQQFWKPGSSLSIHRTRTLKQPSGKLLQECNKSVREREQLEVKSPVILVPTFLWTPWCSRRFWCCQRQGRGHGPAGPLSGV